MKKSRRQLQYLIQGHYKSRCSLACSHIQILLHPWAFTKLLVLQGDFIGLHVARIFRVFIQDRNGGLNAVVQEDDVDDL